MEPGVSGKLRQSSRTSLPQRYALTVFHLPQLGVLEHCQPQTRRQLLSSDQRRGLIQHEPVEAELAGRFDELLEVHRFANVAVGAKVVTGHAIALPTATNPVNSPGFP